ncbi:hypothetical protein ACFU9F_31385 [Streptomyces zhihengii]|uniref:hypothetical protein n=1 Tax=Streptomyces zhihengii TaxID=1818004 RepID=UPI00368A6413
MSSQPYKPCRSSRNAQSSMLTRSVVLVRRTHEQILQQALDAVGGTWDTGRAVTSTRGAGVQAADQRAREKQARRALRKLHRRGVLVKIRDRPATVPAPARPCQAPCAR